MSEREERIIEDEEEEEIKREKIKIIKNIFLLSFVFFLSFQSFNSLLRLQSSLHHLESLGTISSSLIYISILLTCLFLPTISISYLGHKNTIIISLFTLVFYTLANGVASWFSLVPASICLGLGIAPLWTSTFSYFALEADKFSKLSPGKYENLMEIFFGVFFMFHQLSCLSGALISSAVLKTDQGNNSFRDLEVCGRNDCPWNSSTSNLNIPSKKTVWILLVIYTVITLVSIGIVFFFVEKISVERREKSQANWTMIKKDIRATMRHCTNKYQLLLVPITLYGGFELTYLQADFNKSFVACSLGIWKVGFATVPYATVNAFCSLTMGFITRFTGKFTLFTYAFIQDLCVHLVLYLWIPNPEQEYLIYIVSGVWGASDGIWKTQVNALYASLFIEDSEAAFSTYSLFEAVATITAFGYSSYICTFTKTFILTFWLVTGYVGFFVVHILEKSKKKKEILNKTVFEDYGLTNKGFETVSTDEGVANGKKTEEKRKESRKLN